MIPDAPKQIDPARLNPLRGMIVVRRYERPEVYGSIVLPPTYQTDQSGKLWEIVKWSDEAEEHFAVGRQTAEEAVIEVRLRGPGDNGAVPTGLADLQGRPLWVMDYERIYGFWPAEEVDDED